MAASAPPPDVGDVLVVEDDPPTQELLARLLARRRITVTVVGTAAAGLEQAGHGSLRLVVLDLGLPDRDGAGVLRSLRAAAATERTPVIVVSADPDRRYELLGLGAVAYLTKPIDVARLYRAVDAALTPEGARSDTPREAP